MKEVDIILKKILGKASDDELLYLDEWLKDERHRKLYDKIMENGEFSNKYRLYESIDMDKAWTEFCDGIAKRQASVHDISEVSSHGKSRKNIYAILRPVLQTAAVLLIVFGAGWLFFNIDDKPVPPEIPQVVAEAMQRSEQTGKSEAEVVIRGKKGNMVKVATNEALSAIMSDVSADADTECELYTENTREFWLTLEDGTRVHLNYNSRLTFPVHFSDDNRTVYLEGEAYFYVAKEKDRPFMVKTKHGVVKEYGTEFNVNTKAGGESTEVVLVEGSISIITTEGIERMMCPNDRAIMEPSGDVVFSQIDTAPYKAWNEGKFLFEDCRLESLMSVISKWYGCSVTYRNDSLRSLKLTGTFDRYGSIDDILESIKAVTGIKIEKKDNKLLIK